MLKLPFTPNVDLNIEQDTNNAKRKLEILSILVLPCLRIRFLIYNLLLTQASESKRIQ